MPERAMFKGIVDLIIKKDDKVLLFFKNDGFFNYDVGCRIEQHKTAQDAVIREAKKNWTLILHHLISK